METIVLVTPPNEKIIMRDMYSSTISKGLYAWPNADLLAVSGRLKSHYDVRFIDANVERLSFQAAVDAVVQLQPMGICVAVGASEKDQDYAFISELKRQLPDARIIGSGGILYHNAEEELREFAALDACLKNYVTDDVLKYFQGRFDELRNVVYRRGDEIVTTPLEAPENGFAFDVPVHEQLPLKRYRLSHGRNVPLASVVTSYGCPAKCSFCVSGRINYSYRDPMNVIEELEYLKKLGVREIFFKDNWFGANRKQAETILDEMIARKFNFSWVSDTRAEAVQQPEFVRKMRQAGCHAVHMGVESYSELTRKSFQKTTSTERVRTAFRNCREAGISTLGYFILGLPGETREDVLRTIDFAIELDCTFASFNIPIPIVGTNLRDELEQAEALDAKTGGYDGSSAPLIETTALKASEIVVLRNVAYRRFYFRPGFVLNQLRHIRTFHQVKMLSLEGLKLLQSVFVRKAAGAGDPGSLSKPAVPLQN